MADWQKYLQPGRIDEALAALAEAGGRGRVVAGGTDLLLDIHQGRHPRVEVLVDVARIPELAAIEVQGEFASVGAAVPHAAIVAHPVLQARASALTEACSLIGGPQVRMVATLGGNVAHALPAADGTIALLSLDAEAELASTAGRRWLPVEALFTGPGEVSFDRSREIIVRFRFRLARPREGSAFYRVMRPQGVAIAILNMACWLRVDGAGSIEAARLACGPAGPTPRRMRSVETALIGKPASETQTRDLVPILLDEASFRTSRHRATADYRRHLVEPVLSRVLRLASERAAVSGSAG